MTKNDKTILITGCNGLLGRQAVREFISAGYTVKGVDVTQPITPIADFEFHEVNLESKGLEGLMSGVAGVVHLAGLPTPHLDTQLNTYLRNTTINARVFHSILETDCRQVVYASSQSALGYAYAPSPQIPHYVPVDEAHPTINQEMYGLSKLMGEELLKSLWRSHQLASASLRFPVIWDHENFGASIEKRQTDPTRSAKSMWSYVDLRDAGRACRLAFEAKVDGAVIANIASSVPLTDGNIISQVREWYGEIKGVGDLTESTAIYDAETAFELFGFRANYQWSSEGITHRSV